MGRNIIFVILGVIGGSILVGLIESIGHRLYGSQVPVDTSDPDAMREFVASHLSKHYSL